MNARERWYNTFHFKSVDRVPNYEFGYWNETYDVWHQQGLPKEIDDEAKANKFFGFDYREEAPINVDLCPHFEYKVLEETDVHLIIRDGDGVKCEIKKDGTSSIPHFLEFPIKNRQDWNEFKKRLDPSTPARYPSNWEELKQKWAHRDYPLGIHFGSIFGRLRDWMGLENIAVMMYDDPVLIEDMMEHMTELSLAVMEKALNEVQFDFASGWEDMAYNHGPMISPAMIKKYMVPRYKRITDVLHKHGIDVIFVDCDGNINEMVPLFLEGGINCMFPIEVNSGTDPVELRRRYGKDILLLGGVNKIELAKGKKEIEEQIKRLAPVVEEGGFIPHVDHRCPPSVPYENYLYYLELKRKAFCS